MSIKKSPVYLFISYKNDEFSNNLYCSNLSFVRENEKKELQFDFEAVIKSRVNSNSKDDLNYLIENYDSLKIIQIIDPTVIKKIRNYLKNGENIKVNIFVSKLLQLDTRIEYRPDNELILKISGR